MRKAGVLLPIASLPSAHGVGDFGLNAYKFIDILHEMDMKIWQVLPINSLGFGNSPYQSYSSFAGEELYISIEELINDGFLDSFEVFNPISSSIDYPAVRANKQQYFIQAFNNFKAKKLLEQEYSQFVNSTTWLYNYAVFITLKKNNQLKTWTDWPEQQKNWIKDHKFDLTPFVAQIEYELFLQFIFFRQWFKLKSYANQRNIQIMGDIPIYTGFDSLDVWENQDVFLLDSKQQPTFVAGVPPDYFSATGQRWGNPLYDWEFLKETNFEFWIRRLRENSKFFDIVRIDHFRAFDTYWKIPINCPTAVEGEWVEAPGYALFDAIYAKLPEINIVAEDLGDLREEVLKLRDHYNLKGMKIFQFKFDITQKAREVEETLNTILYTGTHDNNTLMGWYEALTSEEQQQINVYFSANNDTLKHQIISYIMKCEAEYVIIPVQDIIGINDSARINTPSTVGSPNWEWKLINFEPLYNEVLFINDIVNVSNR